MKDPESMPPADFDDLVVQVFHGLADDAARTRLAKYLADSAAARERFLDHVGLEGFLAEEAKAGGFAENRAGFFATLHDPAPDPVSHRSPRRVWLTATVAAMAAVFVGLAVVITTFLPVSASAAIDRLIAAYDRPVDRTYRITVLEGGADPASPAAPDRGRFPPNAFLDNALLFLRGKDCLVFTQTLPNGETRTMGSDGGSRWSIRGDGPVRVSVDPSRFSGPTAYDRQGLSFLDLRSQIAELRDHYQLKWLPERPASRTAPALRGLHGFRQSAAQGGAKEFEVWFDPATGLIHRMVLGGLPRGGGGPAKIALELDSTAPLAPGFFHHEAHHEPGRRIETEPSSN